MPQTQGPESASLTVPIAEASEGNEALERLFCTENDLHVVNEEIYFQALTGGQTQETEPRREWLTFSLGNEVYALDINGVAEIIKPREVTEIPRVPPYVLGIISLRGLIVPVFDLKRRLRLGAAEQTATSRIIICQDKDLSAGLLVDSITQVVRIAERNIEPPPSMLPDLDADLVEGVGRHQGSFLILLNLDGILRAGVTVR
ncbi:chemotaxis protein CheW [Geoalkalibacter sp.]|uniref:chemotaxis protein CheW n=1 Tax=Geoalkalibacter sp. TaxID=3041440 RepID=UPI00272DFD63|nr:chemotaxis protein CheW [Geoalkalibacter sp.]